MEKVMLKISASINPCPEERAVEYCKDLQRVNVDYIHLDVMRSNFVGHNALNINTIFDIYDNTLVPLDCHLMIDEPLSVLKEYLKLKLNYITIHYEAFKDKKDLLKAIKMIHDKHILVGLSIKPNTFIKDIKEYLPLVDMVLIMGVEPGKSGQKMISNTIPKVKELRSIIYEYRYDLKIEVDGGVTSDNMLDIYNAGADMVVVGSKLYDARNKREFVEMVHNLK